MNAGEDAFGQWQVPSEEDVEGRDENDGREGQECSLPALGSVGGVIEDDQGLYYATDQEGVDGNDALPGDGCKPAFAKSDLSVR